MKIEIFIAVSGGVVQGVRATTVPSPAKHTPANTAPTYKCHVVDYDDLEAENDERAEVVEPGAPAPLLQISEEDFERERLAGRTWAEIEKISVGVW
jgi:hypothetical protein